MGLILTTKCNLKCKYCFYNNDTYSINNADLDLPKFYEFFDNITVKSPIDRLTITGGEPLLRKDLLTFISEISKKVRNILILTNGILLTEQILKDIFKNNVKLGISLDSLNDSYGNKFRGKHSELLKSLQLIHSLGYASKVTLNTTISPNNLTDVEDIVHFSEEMGFSLNLNLMDSHNLLSWDTATVDQKEQLLSIIKDHYNNESNSFHYRLAKFLISNTQYTIPNCMFSSKSIIIDSDGSIVPCFHNKTIIGNIEDEVDFILRNHNKFLKEHKGNFECFRKACFALF